MSEAFKSLIFYGPMVVHQPDRLTSFRLLPGWALLSFAGGAVNLGAFMACQRFVSHVTGTLTRIGADVGDVLGLDYLLVLLSFMVGAAASVVIVRKFGNPERGLPYWIPLSIVSGTLTVVALVGNAGLLGKFGGSVETAHDFVVLCILGFSMGMQNAAVASSTAMAVRTTHMTGPATDLAVAAATLAVGKRAERTRAWASLTLRGTKLTAFVLGAAVMVPVCRSLGFLAFVVPAATCAIATVVNYSPSRIAAALATR